MRYINLPFQAARLLSVILAFALCVGIPAKAEDAPRYEDLMEALAGAGDQRAADTIAAEIWAYWLVAPDETAQEILDAAMQRRQAHDFLGSLSLLDRLVQHYPDYAEGWNQRATLRFLTGDLAGSLEDVDKVLELEPRHFGALSGKGIILFQQGEIALAQVVIRKALQYHPFLRERSILDVDAGTQL